MAKVTSDPLIDMNLVGLTQFFKWLTEKNPPKTKVQL